MNKKTIKYLIIFGIIILIVVGGFFAWQRGWILQKPSVLDKTADWKTYKDVNGLVFDYPSDYFVQKEEKMLGGEEFWISSDKEGKKIIIMLKSFSNPFSPSTFDLGEGPESYYFSLSGKFDGGTSPVYTHINDDCAYNKKNCDGINEYMKLLPQKRYEIVNNKNQKVKIVRYISPYIWNAGSEMGAGPVNNGGLEISFYERYVLDFGFKTVWVRLWEPLIASQIISEDKADEYIVGAIKQINADKNLEKKLSVQDEFVKRISTPTAKLLVRVIDTGEQWKERGIYLADPITKEITQLIWPPYQFSGLYGKNLVVVIKDTNKYYRYDVVKKEYVLLNFPTLKKEGNTYEKLYIVNDQIIGGDKIILSVFTYSINDEVEEYGGDRPVRGKKDYLFSFSQNSFEEAKNVEQAIKLLGYNVNDLNKYWFLGFDEKKQRVFFRLFGAEEGMAAVVNIADNTIQKISAGSFYINPNFDFGFYIESKTGINIATLVSLNDITKPLYTFNLTNAVDPTDLNISSVEWLNDATKVVIGFTEQIAILDFKNNKLETIYKDSTLGKSYLYWDRYTIKSDGQNFFAFVDYYSTKYNDCTLDKNKDCSSFPTGDDRKKVIIQNLSDNSQEFFLDDATSKDVIGWLNW